MKKFMIEFPFFCIGFVPIWILGVWAADTYMNATPTVMAFAAVVFVVASFAGRFCEAMCVDLLDLKRFMQ